PALPLGERALLAEAAVTQALSGAQLVDTLAQPSQSRPRRIMAAAPSPDLPFARLEARAVASEAPLLGADATLSRLLASRADALDLAAHGTLDGTDPLSSSLWLAPDLQGDGRLELREIFGLPELPALVALSGCDTGSAASATLPWLSLGHAFLSAGARTVLASQTRVSDLASALLMKHFFRHVKNEGAADALRRAALTVRERYPHPAHWASFMVLGDFR
ncbi:MAG TPA: CHAT domain-containing protein, partial [Myxococcota bacterium]|nr:CHAT domain-containing protein [Myxococcota bacterium]